MKLSDLGLFPAIVTILLAGEVALEVRANLRGFETLMLGAAPAPGSDGVESREWGPTEAFPFRSPIAPMSGRTKVRVWVASSSYGEDTRFPPPVVFPNAIATILADSFGVPAEALNRSSAGQTVPSNVRELAEDGAVWRPDVAILYQMTNDLNDLAKPGLASGSGTDNGKPARLRWWQIDDRLSRTWERTTLFAQLRANVTPYLTRERLLADTLTSAADSAFAARAESFVDAAESVDALPVLVTFAPRARDPGDLDVPTQLWMLRWNPNQTPQGYLRTIHEWNDTIRSVARRRNVPLIDLEAEFSGRKSLYSDLAHFTREGHAAVARFLAEELADVLLQAR